MKKEITRKIDIKHQTNKQTVTITATEHLRQRGEKTSEAAFDQASQKESSVKLVTSDWLRSHTRSFPSHAVPVARDKAPCSPSRLAIPIGFMGSAGPNRTHTRQSATLIGCEDRYDCALLHRLSWSQLPPLHRVPPVPSLDGPINPVIPAIPGDHRRRLCQIRKQRKKKQQKQKQKPKQKQRSRSEISRELHKSALIMLPLRTLVSNQRPTRPSPRPSMGSDPVSHWPI